MKVIFHKNMDIAPNGKLHCSKHDQALMYVYIQLGEEGLKLICQICEDELAEQKLREQK